MIEQNEKLTGKDWVRRPETTPKPFGEGLSGQNEWFEPKLGDTAAERLERRRSFREVFQEKWSLHRQSLKELEHGAGQHAESRARKRLGNLGRATNPDEERSEEERCLNRRAVAGAMGIFSPPRGLGSIMGTCPC